MSYLLWPSGVPGTGLIDGPYASSGNIHITDQLTRVNAASIQDGLGREIAVLQNYLSTNKFMSGIPIGTGYFYSIGTSTYPVDDLYIINANVYQENIDGDLSLLLYGNTGIISIQTNKATFGDNLTDCKNYISGQFKYFNFTLVSGNMTMSGLYYTLNPTNIFLYDQVGISGYTVGIADTPTGFLTTVGLSKNNIYSRKFYMASNTTGWLDTFNIDDGILGNILKTGIIYNVSGYYLNTTPNFTVDSGLLIFTYDKPYLSESDILFANASGHCSGEGDLSLLNDIYVIISGATFNNLSWSGLLRNDFDWNYYTSGNY